LARSISDYCRLKHRYCDWSDIWIGDPTL
jgi:hypothetical protein